MGTVQSKSTAVPVLCTFSKSTAEPVRYFAKYIVIARNFNGGGGGGKKKKKKFSTLFE